jgi:acyl-CoA synthetase (AMP-forming)/AMP-acid ligase II
MFKSGGYNVYPREVEDVLQRHPAVAHAAVVPVPDPRYQEAGVAYVVASGAPTPGERELIAYCRSELATYKVPRHVEVLPELPLLENGKVDRVSLRAGARARYGSAGESTMASSS